MINVNDTITIAERRWDIISIDDDNVATLLAEDFGKHVYHTEEPGNEYESSSIREYLNSEILGKIEEDGIHPITTNLSDVKCCDKIWLLSSREATKLSDDVLRKGKKNWWTRTKGSCHPLGYTAVWIDGCAEYCNYDLASVRSRLTVRPAMRVYIKDLEKLF